LMGFAELNPSYAPRHKPTLVSMALAAISLTKDRDARADSGKPDTFARVVSGKPDNFSVSANAYLNVLKRETDICCTAEWREVRSHVRTRRRKGWS
jgi:hypothetical protein